MIYTEPVHLISETQYFDDIGNIKEIREEKLIFCKVNLVGTNEFYNATAVGITPTAELLIKSVNYDGQQLVRFKGDVFNIIRTLPKSPFDMVLVIGRKQKNGGN